MMIENVLTRTYRTLSLAGSGSVPCRNAPVTG